MLKLSTIFKVLAACALLMGFGLVVIGSDNPAPIQPLVQGDGADFDLKEQLAPVHEDPEEDDVPDQSTIDQKEAERLARATQHKFELNLRSTPVQTVSKTYLHPMAELFFEGFNAGVPPAGWGSVVNNVTTWTDDDYAPYEGLYNATCEYDATYSGDQDEWIISPPLNLSGGTAWVLDFSWNGSYYWSVDPEDNCDLTVKISTDGGSTWDDLWTEPTDVWENWVWYNEQVSLSGYLVDGALIAFVYTGYDGAQFSLDAMSINDAAPPVGRCCYGVDMLDCADNTEPDCAALSGNWVFGLDCTTGCPTVPDNDEPENAIVIVNGETVTGSTAAATIDCPEVLDEWYAVWYVFEAPYAENDVYINYCGTPNDIFTVGIIVYPEVLPLDCNAYIVANGYAFNDCGDGTTNPDMNWDRLPGPATYLFPVYTDDGLKAGMDFSFDFAIAEAAPLPPGGGCGDPYPLSLGSGDLPHTESGLLTCGLGNAYTETCLGSYDGGEDFIMELTVTEEIEVKITLDALGTTWTGFSLDDECPDTDNTCIDYSTSSGSTPHTIDALVLTAGTYYIMVDTWPTPDCIPDFTLTFEAPPPAQAGDNCGDPYIIKLPDDLVDDALDHVSYTCGRGDNYDVTCLGSYDGGEDMIYMLDVGSEGSYDFVLSSTTTYMGMSIDDECPDADNTCIDYATAYSGDVVILNLTLSAGYYYIQVDTWPSPDCIPDFNLHIEVAGEPDPGDDWEDCMALNGDVVDLPFTTVGTTPDGPEGCQYAPNRWYCYTADEAGMGTVSLCGSSYDTKLAVYDGIDPNTALTMGCNDDAPCTGVRALQSELTDLAFVKDNVYLIEVGGYSSVTGTGVLNISVTPCESPPNDNCEDVTPVTLLHGATENLVGDNTCATNQCASFPGPHTWHAFTLPTQMDVTLDYCGLSPAWGNAWLNLAYGCPCDSFTLAGAYDFTSCGGGNVTITWDDLAAGTYYYPVLKDVGYDAVGPYTLHVVGLAPSELTANPDPIDFGTQPAGSQGDMTLNLGAVGPGDINFSIAPDYSKNVGLVAGLPHLDFGTLDPGPKAPYTGPQNIPSGQKQGGETIATATVIAGLPHNSSGSTAGMVDDYDEACPYSGSTSPDAVYAFTPGASMIVDVTLCNGSGYDTKLYVYEGGETPGAPFACNDDACPGYISELNGLSLTGGTTYYIVIDGYGGDNGDYVLDVTEYVEPDPFECPEGATPEAEACGEDINGGCNGGIFEPIFCGETKCGTAWADGGTRDTDWYTVEFFAETEVTFTAQSNFFMLMGFVDTSDCGLAAAVDPAGFADPDEIVSVTRTCGPGVYWLFVSHQDYYDYPCGTSTDYWCTLTCPEGPVLWLSADPTSGVVPAGGTLPITVSYDATDLTDGVYDAALKITHDGRGEKIVPVTITIGDAVPPDTLVIDPAAIGVYMVNEAEDLDGHIYMGDDLGIVNMDMGSMSIGNGRATIPCTAEYIAYHPGLTAPVMMLTFDLSDFAEMYDEGGLMWDCETRSYTVSGTDDNGAMGAGDDFPYCGHISGDLNLDRQIDIADLVFMVEYMFGGGDAPLIIETADINGDGAVDIADMVAFVDYMFQGGEAPQHP